MYLSQSTGSQIKSSTLYCSCLPTNKFQRRKIMSIVKRNDPPEFQYSGALKTELTLALPGGGGGCAQSPKPRVKRGFSETVDLQNNSEDEASVVTQSSPPEYVYLDSLF